jgi:peptidoglycan/xylan/chitin deacetylase (PgdA/CDA1 family)
MGLSEFSRQMNLLARFYHAIAASDLRKWRTASEQWSRSPVLVTFDDGYRNNLTYAAPVLEHFGIPAVINISTGYISTRRVLWPDEVYLRVLNWPKETLPLPDGHLEMKFPARLRKRRKLAGMIREWCKRFPDDRITEYLAQLREFEIPSLRDEAYAFLSWDEVRILSRRGFEIGSHTVEHPILTRVCPERLSFELTQSKRVIEQETGSECRCFSYPNGGRLDLSPYVIEGVRSAGYSVAFTVRGARASVHDDPLLLDRVYLPEADSLPGFYSRISGFRAGVKRLCGFAGNWLCEGGQ